MAAVLGAIAEHPIADPVRVACADILAARGDEAGALQLLEGGDGPARATPVTSTPGLILVADLLATQGQLPRALGTIERVLAREIDAPGALERHQRWRAALGTPRPSAGRLDEATLLAPTARSGPFKVMREVARGGAGVVYEAEDELLGRKLAFKVYHARTTERGHLDREARLAAALWGPGIVRMLDADPAEGWIALEWVARGSIRDVLRGGDATLLFPIERWARPLAQALARVHAHGYVHADVKPANVLLRQPSEPLLGDFGIARPRGAPYDGGSPGYMSPERLAGRASDPRDDVYGYARVIEDVVVRCETLIAGGASFASHNELEVWRTLSSRCLGPDPERPADGAALLEALP
ncbi:serine/threonine-protein kinase [Chondromyces apiculatus]|uniref:Serine/threonine protein kinase n=1 Tax=Chondromyces apiculatus DSM 436 TaxID=1192034 RepID=A0A017TDI6_9BACT|nr:serine/threonine-protein kinase [Chondromyces apiculatus]EYF07358.1 serine/threonine protein kinase [Chondromyces apiculatus DSM 436]